MNKMFSIFIIAFICCSPKEDNKKVFITIEGSSYFSSTHARPLDAYFDGEILTVLTNENLILEFNDFGEELNSYKVGQDVKVSINLRGREWINPEGVAKYFNAIQGWRVENLSSQAAPDTLPPVDQFQPAANVSDEEPDDLPF